VLQITKSNSVLHLASEDYSTEWHILLCLATAISHIKTHRLRF